MQIITGKYRARKLVGVDSTDTRPTLARVKESVFNLIFDKIEGNVVLDLFAGSGAYGAECISRGAKEVFFVDQAEKAVKTIKTNTQKMTEKFEIIKSSFKDALVSFENRKIKFDLVFLDPPYALGVIPSVLEQLLEYDLLEKDAKIVCETAAEKDVFGENENLREKFSVLRTARYGAAFVTILSPNFKEVE